MAYFRYAALVHYKIRPDGNDIDAEETMAGEYQMATGVSDREAKAAAHAIVERRANLRCQTDGYNYYSIMDLKVARVTVLASLAALGHRIKNAIIRY
ncbi:hypothetical protein F1654_10335 [Alkalicaulis satelles]|uniref:Uncharacterized protein n=1 Tax=Alkalicaulis satelles TaxID=2609175 RepID=A0A5M6ZEI6_9PROT|nr:hypothetical protein [Alkalicaulis satelles]KAA5802227.1 hypothetical protein F1654_10335 [Alkalicaulis satelles]